MKEEKIMKEIEKLRKKMEVRAESLGLNHYQVIKLSQKIDKLHTKLVEIQKSEGKECTINYVQKKKDDFIKEIRFAWNY